MSSTLRDITGQLRKFYRVEYMSPWHCIVGRSIHLYTGKKGKKWGIDCVSDAGFQYQKKGKWVNQAQIMAMLRNIAKKTPTLHPVRNTRDAVIQQIIITTSGVKRLGPIHLYRI